VKSTLTVPAVESRDAQRYAEAGSAAQASDVNPAARRQQKQNATFRFILGSLFQSDFLQSRQQDSLFT
jgi:hypothetical protein